jgi:hypothetical protein
MKWYKTRGFIYNSRGAIPSTVRAWSDTWFHLTEALFVSGCLNGNESFHSVEVHACTTSGRRYCVGSWQAKVWGRAVWVAWGKDQKSWWYSFALRAMVGGGHMSTSETLCPRFFRILWCSRLLTSIIRFLP